MSTSENYAKIYAEEIIKQLQADDEGFIKAEMVNWRDDEGYCEPKIRMENEGGIFEAWACDGESVRDMKWEEI